MVVSAVVVVVVVVVGLLASSWSSVNGLEGVSLVPVAVLLLSVAVFFVLVSGSVVSENV